MASNIDPSVFPDNQAVDKINLRQQFQIAKDEISALQQTASPMMRMMLDDDFWNEV
jgi:hypothetical protein